MQALLDAHWTGGGSTSFQELFAQFHRAGSDLIEALNGISQQLSFAANAYDETEASVQQGFKS